MNFFKKDIQKPPNDRLPPASVLLCPKHTSLLTPVDADSLQNIIQTENARPHTENWTLVLKYVVFFTEFAFSISAFGRSPNVLLAVILGVVIGISVFYLIRLWRQEKKIAREVNQKVSQLLARYASVLSNESEHPSE